MRATLYRHFLTAFVLALITPSFADVQTTETARTFPTITSVAQWSGRAERHARTNSRQRRPLAHAGKDAVARKNFREESSATVIVLKKVYFESSPGFYVCGNLYRPLGRGAGPVPATLVAHGHWEHGRLEDTEVCSFPGLCINLARQGIIASPTIWSATTTRSLPIPRVTNPSKMSTRVLPPIIPRRRSGTSLSWGCKRVEYPSRARFSGIVA